MFEDKSTGKNKSISQNVFRSHGVYSSFNPLEIPWIENYIISTDTDVGVDVRCFGLLEELWIAKLYH